MHKLSTVEKEIRRQERQKKRGLFERKRKRKFDHLKNSNQLVHYYSEKWRAKKEIRRAESKKALKDYKPLIIKEDKSLTLWERAKAFFSVIKKILRK